MNDEDLMWLVFFLPFYPYVWLNEHITDHVGIFRVVLRPLLLLPALVVFLPWFICIAPVVFFTITFVHECLRK